MFSSISLSRWKRTSSSSSSSILDLNKSARNRSLSLLSMTISSHSGRFQNQFHRPGESSPGLGLHRQLFPAGGGQFVIFGLPVVLRRPPLRGDPIGLRLFHMPPRQSTRQSVTDDLSDVHRKGNSMAETRAKSTIVWPKG